MVCQLIKFFDSLDVGSNDGLLLLEDPDVSINFHISKLLVLEISESSRNLILTLVIKQDVEGTSVIIYFKLSPHRLFYSPENSTTKNDVIYRISIIFTNIIWSGLRIGYHFYCDRGEYFGFTSLLDRRCAHTNLVVIQADHIWVLLISTEAASKAPSVGMMAPASIIGHEKSARCILVSKHFWQYFDRICV